MIKQETLFINNKKFIKTYSDSNYYIKQVETNILYAEAIDVLPLKYTYIETSEVIENANQDN